MSNVLPMFRSKPQAADVFAFPSTQEFVAEIAFSDRVIYETVDAFTSADAVIAAVEKCFNGEFGEPKTMSIKVGPANVLRAAR